MYKKTNSVIKAIEDAGMDITECPQLMLLIKSGVDFPSNLFITGSSRDLMYFETITLAKFFPLGDISKVKYVGTGSAIVKSLEDPLCVTHDCFQGENVTFHKEKESSYTPYLPKGYQHSRSDNPCISNEFTCLDHKNTITYASYNCIGWAFGVSEWIEPFKLYGTPEEIVTKGVEDAKKDFPANHPSNVLNIIEKLDLDKISTIPILKNNTVAFYFCVDDSMCHAARYLTTLSDGEVLNNWVSKLGHHPELFAHDYEYMLNAVDGCYEFSLFHKECYDRVYFVPVKDEEIMGKSLDFREF